MSPAPPSADPRIPTCLPAALGRMFGALLPVAEREEVLGDIAREYADRRARAGALSARRWLWGQLFGSLPALLRRGWWRGRTGFEPRANRMQPGGPMFESMIMDARYAVRRLASRPAFAITAVVTLALGAGGSAAIFSVVRALLLAPLPVQAEERVGVLWFDGSWNEQEFTRLRPAFPGFEQVAAWRPGDTTLQVAGEALRMVPAVVVTAELFDVLGTPALIGQTFRQGADVPGTEPSVVLSHRFWQQQGADPAIVGRQLQFGGTPRTVIGVMPPGFWFPTPVTDVWLSAALNPARRVGEYALVGRVTEEHQIDNMHDPLASLAATLGRQFTYPPQWDKTRAPSITPLREYLLGNVRPALVATLAAMALILVIACVNVATLMLGQISGRSIELSVRAALGAARRRLLQQLSMEALLLGLLAGVLGAGLAAAGFRVLVAALPLGELATAVRLEWTLFWGAMVVAMLSAATVALVSGLALQRNTVQDALQATRTAGISAHGGGLERALVVGQIATAVLLVAGAGLLIRSVANLRAIDPGADVRAVAVLDVTAPSQMGADARRSAFLSALPALQTVPGVRAAAVTQKLPLRGKGDNWGVQFAERPDLQGVTTYVRVVSDDYFKTLGITVTHGRGFVASDRASSGRVVVINDAFAEKYFAREDPVGRVLNTGFDQAGERIIGVVENVAEADLTDGPVPARYMLYEHVGTLVLPRASYVIRANGPAELPALVQTVRDTLTRNVPQLALRETTTMQTVFDRALGPVGQLVILVSLLAGLALVLGAVGLYGVISHFVTRRTRDYGIYIALGLSPARVMLQVVRRGMAMVATGSVIGLLAAYALTGMLASLLYGIAATDPWALAGAVFALLVVGTVAASVPALRASRTDPTTLLRQL